MSVEFIEEHPPWGDWATCTVRVNDVYFRVETVRRNRVFDSWAFHCNSLGHITSTQPLARRMIPRCQMFAYLLEIST